GGTIIAIIADIALIVRLIWKRHIRLRQPFVWKKYRKMTIQLLSVSIFCSSFNLPMLVYGVLMHEGIIPNINSNGLYSVYFMNCFGCLFVPIVMIRSLPKKYWWEKWWKTLVRRRQRQ
ncbi:unnamed protein product, partial [Rotaria sp. Silwood2]